MTKRIRFEFGEIVRVKEPGERAFKGKVYSEYRDGPRTQRLICVINPSGCGVAYPIRQVHKIIDRRRRAA